MDLPGNFSCERSISGSWCRSRELTPESRLTGAGVSPSHSQRCFKGITHLFLAASMVGKTGKTGKTGRSGGCVTASSMLICDKHN